MQPMNRRSLLKIGGSAALSTLLPVHKTQADQTMEKFSSSSSRAYALKAQPTKIQIGPESAPPTALWAFNSQLPGPALRIKKGNALHVIFENHLPEPSSIHWHGVRVPNAMDGVPGLTQKAVSPGEQFHYKFRCPDAGTFWYHPHYNSSEQLGRGLIGALVVEDDQPVEVDQDLTWTLSDLRINREGQITNNFGNLRDAAHAGRIGNVVLINGSIKSEFTFPTEQRIRLRLIAASNARVFGLRFLGGKPWLIALDGHPTPVTTIQEDLVLAPGQRADLIIDIPATDALRVEDHFYARSAYELARLKAEQPVVIAREVPATLRRNPINPPVLTSSTRTVNMLIEGGAHSPVASANAVWRLSGQSMTVHADQQGARHQAPSFRIRPGETIRINLHNQTSWLHPMHFHGAIFQVINSQTDSVMGALRDTLLLGPGEKTSIALCADELGIWMIHCHILEHQSTGLMGVFEVS